MNKLILSLVVTGALAASAAAENPNPAPAPADKPAAAAKTGKVDKKAKAASTLAAGRYSAKVKMLACEGCGPEVEKTLNGIKGVEGAKVDSKASTVEFAVKSPVKVASLQKALKGAADQMGMGADYSLSKIAALQPAAKN